MYTQTTQTNGHLDNPGPAEAALLREMAAFLKPDERVGSYPARNRRGRLTVPPDQHVLDNLARRYALVSEEATMWSSGPGTVSVVAELPACGWCDMVPARYDLAATGWLPACFLCTKCADGMQTHSLGHGRGSYLMLLEEVPSALRTLCEAVLAEQQRTSPWTE